MKKIVISMIALIALSLGLASFAVFGPTFAAGLHTQQVATTVPVQAGISCKGAQDGNLLINVTEKVSHDADSGLAGNYWAMDTFTRTMKVWNIGTNSYCAIVWYTGTFVAVKGQQNPGSTGAKTKANTLTGDENGIFVGGAQILITGFLHVAKPNLWPLAGKVHSGQVVDYHCHIQADGTLNPDPCSGSVDWTTRYFDTTAAGYTFNEPVWGFTYVDSLKADGVWQNWSSGSKGTIQDADAN